MNVLVIEDEVNIAKPLCRMLEKNNITAESVNDGLSGYLQARRSTYDVIVLDIMLPEMDGLSVLKKLREESVFTPILLLTAKDSTEDKVRGLELGADDYLTKPFAMPELLARIRMVSRRGSGSAADHRLRAGDLVLDTQTYTLSCSKNDRNVRLGAKEYQLMEYLMRNVDQVLSREQITRRVWGYDADAEYNNVDVYMSFLRKKIKFVQSGAKIGAVRGVGYELEAGE